MQVSLAPPASPTQWQGSTCYHAGSERCIQNSVHLCARLSSFLVSPCWNSGLRASRPMPMMSLAICTLLVRQPPICLCLSHCLCSVSSIHGHPGLSKCRSISGSGEKTVKHDYYLSSACWVFLASALFFYSSYSHTPLVASPAQPGSYLGCFSTSGIVTAKSCRLLNH